MAIPYPRTMSGAELEYISQAISSRSYQQIREFAEDMEKRVMRRLENQCYNLIHTSQRSKYMPPQAITYEPCCEPQYYKPEKKKKPEPKTVLERLWRDTDEWLKDIDLVKL
jgi:hypothetical protein